MVNLQEWLEQEYPDKNEVREINSSFCPSPFDETRYQKFIDTREYLSENVEGGSLVIQDYPNLSELYIYNNLKSLLTSVTITNCPNLNTINFAGHDLTDIDLSHCPQLTTLELQRNKFTSIDFLITLPNPEKLEELTLSSNQIQPTTLDFVQSFPNLSTLLLGVDQEPWEKEGKCNLFYGSLEPLRNLTKLQALCIAGTVILTRA
jgi:Leucine-rich repeat (LRR) protein